MTTSVINKYLKEEYKNAERSEEERKNLYLKALLVNINQLKKFPQIKIIIVENNGNSDTYLNIFPENYKNVSILYTNYNKHNYYHKGYAEMYDIKAVIQEYNIQDDDLIIKMTGRYHLVTDYFIDTIFNKADDYDAFFKFYNVSLKRYMNNDCILGAFALRAKYLKDFEYKDIYLSPEAEMAKYLIEKAIDGELKLCKMEDLLVKCTFAENGENIIV